MPAPLGQTDFGSDVSCFPTLDPSFSAITGTRVAAEAIARRLMTPRGTLPDAPNYGTDVRAYLNESMTPTVLTSIKRDIERECLQDERVAAADAAVYFNPTTGALNVTIVVGLASGGSFKFILNVTAVTVTLLSTG